jgi:type IV pilus assembly protein PilQ
MEVPMDGMIETGKSDWGDRSLSASRGGLTAVLLASVLIFGCAAEQKMAQKDPFFEKWSTMAETSQGHSVAPRERILGIPDQILEETKEAREERAASAAKELPKQLVSLKMRQADIKTILRSLAQIVDLNILVKNEIKGEMTIDFKDVPWNQVFNSLLRTQNLTYAWERDILRVMTLDDMEQDLKRKTQEAGIRQVEPLHTVVVPIDFAKPKDLKDTIESLLTRTKDGKPYGSVRVDEYSNSLIISAIRDDLKKMMPMIEAIDKPMPQIRIKANIIETSKDTARNLGIQWGGMYARTVGSNNLYVTPGGTGGTAVAPGSALSGGYSPTYGTSGISGQGFGVNFPVGESAVTTAGGLASLGLMFGAIGGNILDVQLNALQNDGKLNILSSPSITTLDNQLAWTENGEKVPFSTLDTSVTPPTRTVKFEDAVLRLEITPHVIDGKNLLMKIVVKKDEVDLSRTVDGNPFIIKKQTVTSLIVQDGETIVISGLTKQRVAKSESGVPWLKEIPFLGYLFKGDEKAEKMEEVLIFITPTILPALAASVKAAPASK